MWIGDCLKEVKDILTVITGALTGDFNSNFLYTYQHILLVAATYRFV